MENSFDVQNTATSRAPAVGRAIAILRLLAESRQPLGVSEIARCLEASKGTVHGILQVLRAEGAVEDVAGKKVRLGPLVEELARRRRSVRSLEDVCRPHLERLVEETGQTSALGIPEGDRLRIAVAREGGGALRVGAAPGMKIPLLAGATGKVALAWGAAALNEPLPRFTDRTVADRKALEEEVGRVRAQGVGFDRGEYLGGVVATAAPVLAGGRLLGILYAVGFEDELAEEGLAELGAKVREAAGAASREMEGS